MRPGHALRGGARLPLGRAGSNTGSNRPGRSRLPPRLNRAILSLKEASGDVRGRYGGLCKTAYTGALALAWVNAYYRGLNSCLVRIL